MKITKTYSIEKSVYGAFDTLTIDKNINKSSFIVGCIKKLLKDNNIDTIDKLYSSISNPDVVVSVISQDDTYYFLNDGSKIQRILFMHIFKEYESVDPNKFFSESSKPIEEIVEKIKNDDIVKETKFDISMRDIGASIRKMFEESELEKSTMIKKLRDEIDSGFYDNM